MMADGWFSTSLTTITSEFANTCSATTRVMNRPPFCSSGTGPRVKSNIFEHLDWYPVSPDGYAVRNEFHFELTDQVRAHVIKRAHDLGASIVEVHSHGGPMAGCFFTQRSIGISRVCTACVVASEGAPLSGTGRHKAGFDGLAWIGGPDDPQRLEGIVVDGQMLTPTGLSSLTQDGYEY